MFARHLGGDWHRPLSQRRQKPQYQGETAILGHIFGAEHISQRSKRRSELDAPNKRHQTSILALRKTALVNHTCNRHIVLYADSHWTGLLSEDAFNSQMVGKFVKKPKRAANNRLSAARNNPMLLK